MISRALAKTVILLCASVAGAGPITPTNPAMDGKVLPPLSQQYFEPESKPAPRLLPLSVREPLPSKYAPPTVQVFAAMVQGTFDSSVPVRVASAVLNALSQPLVKRAHLSQSDEPPLVEIP